MTEPAPLLDAGVVEDAVRDTLELFAEDYLARVERAKGLPVRSMPKAKRWKLGAVFEWEAVDQLPLGIIIGGTVAPSRRTHSGYIGSMIVSVALVVENQILEDAARESKRLLAAYKTLLSEHPAALGATDVRWTGDEHDILAKQGRRVSASEATFEIHLPLGPFEIGSSEPSADPYEPPADAPTMSDESTLNITQEATP